MAVAGLVGLVVVAVLGIVIYAIAKGEEQSHDWAGQVAATYKAAAPGTPVARVRRRLGEPSATGSDLIHGRRARCTVYRVLLPSRELVPYRFCFVGGRLVAKSRSWKDVPSG
jgi:hypothetical protein